jgi:hypothetical protein
MTKAWWCCMIWSTEDVIMCELSVSQRQTLYTILNMLWYGLVLFGPALIKIFWVVAPYSVAIGYQSVGETCCLRLHFTVRMEATRLPKCSHPIKSRHDVSTWKWRQNGPPEFWYPTTTLNCVTTQKIWTWIFASLLTLFKWPFLHPVVTSEARAQ